MEFFKISVFFPGAPFILQHRVTLGCSWAASQELCSGYAVVAEPGHH